MKYAPKPAAWWTDEEFLRYVEIHSQTERALFHRDYVNRLCRLAGYSDDVPAILEWEVLRYENIQSAIEKAREHLSKLKPKQYDPSDESMFELEENHG